MSLQTVYSYHDRTKHHLNRYARSLGFMDWSTQPNPFRRYKGAPLRSLELPEDTGEPTYDSLYSTRRSPEPVNAASLSRLLYLSLALSAWKVLRRPDGTYHSRWSLRVNPSSGNLHPTEGYVICGPVEGLCETAGVYHYAPHEHGLELRCQLDADPGGLFVGLASIHWRESWKYGERAFRYCQHDVGHAIGAVTIAAASFGWSARLVEKPGTAQLARLLGIDSQTGPEAEHADCLVALGEPGEFAGVGEEWLGKPNKLSSSHHPWPVIDEVSEASQSPGCLPDGVGTRPRSSTLPDRGPSAHRIIRQRRSAVDMDGETGISAESFFRILQRVMPNAAPMPFGVLGWRPTVSLGIFVHRVEGVETGLYALVRDPSHEESLRQSLLGDCLWEKPAGCPNELPLYLLLPMDVKDAARTVSCHQDIAADGAFSLGMLASFDSTLRTGGTAMYPRMFWETGLIGQVLYLEAEAAGVRATGIGCFFDDAFHRTVGIEDHSWQSLYHFTVGGPVEDPRLETAEAYAHRR